MINARKLYKKKFFFFASDTNLILQMCSYNAETVLLVSLFLYIGLGQDNALQVRYLLASDGKPGRWTVYSLSLGPTLF